LTPFDQVLREGGHLCGYSWEIKELDLWGDLRELLDYVARRRNVICADNRHVLELALSQSSCLAGAGVS
jgi:hypothetical protein